METKYNKKYYENNKEKFKENSHKFYENNKEKFKEYNKIAYENNKEDRLERQRLYRIANSESFICGCGSRIMIYNTTIHNRTNKHTKYIESLTFKK